MRVDQAIYTSLPRSGREGYHVVSRSPGVSEADARALASWSPSHGSLIVDDANRTSANIHPVGEGRLAVSRTCQGRPEYSGRGGRQIYTHAIFLETALLQRLGIAPIALYFDALALGVFRYHPNPEPLLEEAELGDCHQLSGERRSSQQPPAISPTELIALRENLISGKPIELSHAGDRSRFVEQLLGLLPKGLAITLSFSTSLKPSTARPFALCLIP